jgi:hypothetical protein
MSKENKIEDTSDNEISNDLVEELSTNEIYLHSCHGKGNSPGQTEEKNVGKHKYHPDISEKELFRFYFKSFSPKGEYSQEICAWTPEEFEDTINHQFEAKVFGKKRGSSYDIEMFYFDNTHDDRNACFARYAIAIPEDKIDGIVPKIKENPELLLDVFRKVYPGYDNSKGNMTIKSVDLRDLS